MESFKDNVKLKVTLTMFSDEASSGVGSSGADSSSGSDECWQWVKITLTYILTQMSKVLTDENEMKSFER